MDKRTLKIKELVDIVESMSLLGRLKEIVLNNDTKIPYPYHKRLIYNDIERVVENLRNIVLDSKSDKK